MSSRCHKVHLSFLCLWTALGPYAQSSETCKEVWRFDVPNGGVARDWPL
jgi:hypothetical protein